MSANILLSLLPGAIPSGAPSAQPGGAGLLTPGGDAAAFLALLDGAALDDLTPRVQQSASTGERAQANAALALQTLPEIAPDGTPPDASIAAETAIAPEAETASLAPPPRPATETKTPSHESEPTTGNASHDAPYAELQDEPAVAASPASETTEPATTTPAPDTRQDTKDAAPRIAEPPVAQEAPAPVAQAAIVVPAQTPAQPRTASAPGGERKIDPDGKPASPLEGGTPLGPDQADAAPEAPADSNNRPDARDGNAKPSAQAAAKPDAAPAPAQAANNAAPPPPAPEAISAAARPEQTSISQTDPAQSARGAALSPAAASVAQQIVRRFDGGTTRFEIRLDPAELGRVDVRLEVSRDKKVTATISAENPQTLQDLSRASRELQRALAEAGLEMADNGLTFSERREQGAWQRADTDGELRGREFGGDAEDAAPVEQRRLGIERWGGSRVDVWV